MISWKVVPVPAPGGGAAASADKMEPAVNERQRTHVCIFIQSPLYTNEAPVNRHRSGRARAVAFVMAAALSTFGRAAAQSAPATPPLSPAEMAKADGGHPPYVAADVQFMQGMIGHHAQAVVMAGWVPTHGGSVALQRLASRIDVAQRDEIAFMQRWLRERHETAPEPGDAHQHAGMAMPGMTLMPGMLTPEQMAELDQARGQEFDRLFMTFMVQHHRGALSMVEQLFASPGAGQDDDIFKFASDVASDQTAEIDRMTAMLAELAAAPKQR